MYKRQKRALAVHDISCIGKCSLTVALPIISAGGIETSVLPTAVLSTHTGIENYSYRDLSNDFLTICNHWKTLNIKFDSIYTGFLGSVQQIDMVLKLFELFGQDSLKLVDPVMADDGKLYSSFDETFPSEMKRLCEKADIIVPNITEACYILAKNYTDPPYTSDFIENLLFELSEFTKCKKIVLTGVSFEKEKIGVAILDGSSNRIRYYFNEAIKQNYPGSGDVFASVLLTSLLNGFDLFESSKIAVDFTYFSVKRTFENKTDPRFGLNFEEEIPNLISALHLY